MASITSSLQRIKDNPLSVLDPKLIEAACRECNYSWRDRELDPATTIALCMQQVVRGNISCSEVRHVAASMDLPRPGASFTTQAFCDARIRLPLAVYHTLLTHVYEQVVPATRREEHLWHGHRTFHIDGSTFSRAEKGRRPIIDDPPDRD